MSQAYQFYLSTLLVYFGVDIMACWALNLQLGVAGIVNFAFIMFQAVGAYTAAALTLHGARAGGLIPAATVALLEAFLDDGAVDVPAEGERGGRGDDPVDFDRLTITP